MNDHDYLIVKLQSIADERFGGYVAIMKSPTGWQVNFGPSASFRRESTQKGMRFVKAIESALVASLDDSAES
jgi:hypothetical protein